MFVKFADDLRILSVTPGNPGGENVIESDVEYPYFRIERVGDEVVAVPFSDEERNTADRLKEIGCLSGKKAEAKQNIDGTYSDSDQKNITRKFLIALFNAQSNTVKNKMMADNAELMQQITEANEFIEAEIQKVYN